MHALKLSNMVKNKVGSVEILPRRGTWNNKGDVSRNHRARIDVITDTNGSLHEGKAVPKAFVDHYVGFLGKEDISIIPITSELFDVRIDHAVAIDMIREVTVDEIKRTI
ncbi:hypothetical protein QVD17_19964 [Tagetes erecta]|uniref:Uncharacterized protein n=1 Tax=Tagetes erecta TaxID=13708 RepID=A0AAD8KP11_TARER|nr:hypothetical protein QVD17_19964 [Tagetes erecta]